MAFVIGRGAQAVATFALMLLAVRWLPLVDYGAYMLIWGLCEVAVPLTSLGLIQALQQFLPRLASQSNPQAVRRFVQVMALTRLAATVLVVGTMLVMWPTFSAWIGLATLGDRSSGLVVALLMFAVLGSRYLAEILECLLEQRDAQLVRAIQPVARLAGLVALWLAGAVSLQHLLWLDIAVSAAALLLGQTILARHLPRFGDGTDPTVPWKEVWSFAGHLSLSQCVTALGDAGAVRLVAGRVLGLEAVGVFAFMQQLMITANRYLPSILLANVVRPMLVVRHAAGDLAMVGHGIALLWKLNLLLMCGAVVVTAAGGDGLMRQLSGGAAVSAGLMMVLLLIGLLGSAMSQVAVMAMLIQGQSARVAWISLMALTTLVLAWAGGVTGALFGLVLGVAISMLLRGVVVTVVAQSGAQPAALDWPGMARVLLVTAVLSITGALLSGHLWPLASAGLAGLAFLGLLRLLRPLTAAEGDLVGRALGRHARWLRGWSAAG